MTACALYRLICGRGDRQRIEATTAQGMVNGEAVKSRQEHTQTERDSSDDES